MLSVKQVVVSTGVHYLYSPTHRNGTPNKSQWRITEPQELDVFQFACTNSWTINDVGWGLHIQDGVVAYLGVSQDHQTDVFIAKFVNDVPHSNWHGYPADHMRNPQDIPDETVINEWLQAEIIRPAALRKIGKGQPCKL